MPKSSASKDVPTPLPPTYEAALQELEGLLARLDAGQLPLDELLTQYQRGAELLKFCRGRLDAVEQQIQVLENNELKPWTGGAA
jgi:exodeoxyribonuclease VII small subunit